MPLTLTATFASFRHRNYRLFFVGHAVSLVGSWMQAVAQNWLILILTDSAFLLGLAGALHTLPILLFSFWGGVLADHTDRRRLLVGTNSAAMFLALTMGILVAGHWVAVWHILILIFGLGMAMAFDIPGRQSFIMELVGKDDLPNAIALNSSLFNGTRMLGPAVAGLIIASVGIANCFFVNVLSYLAPLAALSLMRLAPPGNGPRPSTFRGVREMWAHLRRQPALGWMLALTAVISIFALSYAVLLPKIARDVLGVGARGYGFLMAASGLGAFLGALLLATLIRRHHPMLFFGGGAALLCVALFLFSCTDSYPVALVCLFFAGCGMTVQVSTGNSLLQLNVPDNFRGRIMSLFSLTFLGTAPLGSLLYGALATCWGPCLTVRLGVVLAAVVSLAIFLLRPELRRLNFPASSPTPAAPGPASRGA